MLAALMRGYMGEDSEVTETQLEQIGRNIKAAEEAIEVMEQMRPVVAEHSQMLSISRELPEGTAIEEVN
jgi:uncharacterized protein Yka (UPF0111/DUF47 family)